MSEVEVINGLSTEELWKLFIWFALIERSK